MSYRRLDFFECLKNWSTVAGLGIHAPCFQAKERWEMYLRAPVRALVVHTGYIY